MIDWNWLCKCAVKLSIQCFNLIVVIVINVFNDRWNSQKNCDCCNDDLNDDNDDDCNKYDSDYDYDNNNNND